MKSLFTANNAWVNGRELRRNTAIVVENGCIEDVISRETLPTDLSAFSVHKADFLFPGFINSHCHLEYSFMEGRLPRGDSDFDTWLNAIYMLKRDLGDAEYAQSTRDGINRSLAGGTTTVIDTVHRAAAAPVLADSPIRYVLFWEVIAVKDEWAAGEMGRLEERFAMPRGARCVNVGVSPHAPYTVGPELRRLLREFFGKHPDVPAAWHLSETAAEFRLFAEGLGPIVDFYAKREL
ncbi:MAG: amidohydrolase family protein, partial [Candidatus Sumerlaeaceae bacterium]|nr:amidohydrolase family protein [Candidatus Sumerlaeaceae bacterium]